jgi:hypothetical protein
LTSPPGSVLFDKGVIRRVYERRVRLALGAPPTLLQVEAAAAYARAASFAGSLWITEQTANVLRLRTPVFASPILSDCRTLRKGRYLRRWARRLRDFGFSPEDAIVLAYGSFGVSADGSQVGSDAVVTADLKLAVRYEDSFAEIERRFTEMAGALSGVYATLALPRVFTAADVLTKL